MMSMQKGDVVYLKNDLNNPEFLEMDVGIVTALSADNVEVHVLRTDSSVIVSEDFIEIVDPNVFGDAHPFKVCNVCNRVLPTDEFQRNQNGVNNRTTRRPSCNDCRRIIDGVPIPAAVKREFNKTRPVMVPFKCPICQKVTIPPLTSKVVIDHDHETGEIIGWLCDSCNTGLGRFKDDSQVLARAIEYLRNHKLKSSGN
jgi:hypothetical protein